MNGVAPSRDFTQEEVEAGISKLKEVGIETGYDKVAIESYAVFKKLRNEGVIPPTVRFQVCIPSVANVVSPFIETAFQPGVYPLYEAALVRAIQNIQSQIPHSDLSIQLDLSIDNAFWDGKYMTPWFADSHDVKDFVVAYILRMIEPIAQDVELGIHNCYGDMEHKHFFEPESMQPVVERGLKLFEKAQHKINYFHAQVPVSAMGDLEGFLEPLKDLVPMMEEHGTELYLGVVQHEDREGTRKRIEAAEKVVGRFGVATECGMGRTPVEQIEEILRLSAEVAEPVL
ncbi:hypothetical protein DE146DRAFT_607461 [Phaeosphaeria sp. MPI-PUGE-AT-0046c]|nr:hypothetical protein DE146DRAFT_607461 [Phaeosphaeria sp. MPI-PUGE-AT-0046c]